MPFIEVKIIEGVLPDDKKHELIQHYTCLLRKLRQSAQQGSNHQIDQD